MAKFLNKKEQVYDLKLTSYGHYLISIGKFKPIYYEFFDDNILYDGRYAMHTGSEDPEPPLSLLYEGQNEVHKRIKDETQYLESLVLFEEVENNIGKLSEGQFEIDITATQASPREDIFKYDEGIGDAFLNAGSQVAPAWKIVALQGLISSSLFKDSINNSKIPQVNIDLNYRKAVAVQTFIDNPETVYDLTRFSIPFKDGNSISLISDDAVVYIEESNTTNLIENFDIEVFKQEIEDPERATAEISFKAFGTGINGQTITINDGTTSVTFTFTTGTVDSSTKINAADTGPDGEVVMAQRTHDVISNYVADSSNTLKVSVAQSDSALIITNTSGIGRKTNSEGTSARVTSSNENKIVTNGGFFTGGKDSKTNLERKYFKKELPQVVNGVMISKTPIVAPPQEMHTGSVEYYFDIITDDRIKKDIACRGAEEFNKESLYVNLDFDCSFVQDKQVIFNDIYGRVTEPDICLD